jgi:hypothetical protein
MAGHFLRVSKLSPVLDSPEPMILLRPTRR